MAFRDKDGTSLSDFAKDLEKKVKSLPGRVTLPELFDQSFMTEHTDVDSLQKFIDNYGVEFERGEGFKAMTASPEFAEYVKAHTKFDSWDGMLHAANERFLRKHFQE